MKTKLPMDIDLMVDLNVSREDNLLHCKTILAHTLQEHRGLKEPQPDTIRFLKRVQGVFIHMESQRNILEENTFSKYDNIDISQMAKPLLFAYVSRSQRNNKGFCNRVHCILSAGYHSLCEEYLEHQAELRQFGLERINKEIKLGSFLRDFQAIINGRFGKEIGKLTGFYQSFGYLIDKRGQKPEMPSLKLEKYRCITTNKSIDMSEKSFGHFIGILKNPSSTTFQGSLKGLKSLQIDENTHSTVATIHEIIREEGFCEAFVSKIEKLKKDLTLRNSCIQKCFPVSKPKEKEKEISRTIISRPFPKDSTVYGGRRSVCDSMARQLLRNSDNENIVQKLPQRRSVLRQTLVQIVLNGKQDKEEKVLPSLKDKSFRSQAYNLYRRMCSVKEN